MKELFEIIDVFYLPKFGVIISGNGPPCDIAAKESVKQSISSKVLIKFLSGREEVYQVKSKDACFPCFSSDPHWGILISLGFDVELSSIERGAIVYAIEG